MVRGCSLVELCGGGNRHHHVTRLRGELCCQTSRLLKRRVLGREAYQRAYVIGLVLTDTHLSSCHTHCMTGGPHRTARTRGCAVQLQDQMIPEDLENPVGMIAA